MVSAGTLLTNSPWSTGTSSVVLAGGTLESNSTYATTKWYTLSGGSITVDSGQTLTLGGVVSGSGALIKLGNGTLYPSASNTFTGAAAISAGTLLTNSPWSTGAYAVVLAGGTLESNATYTTSKGYTLSGGSITVDSGQTLTLSGVVSGSGQLIKLGSGTLYPSASNTFTGAAVVSAGTLLTNSPWSTGTSSVVLAGGTLESNSTYTTTKWYTLSGGSITVDSGQTLTLSAPVIGTGALVKLGPGDLTLSGSNSYSGGTVLSAGTLAADNAADSTGTGSVTASGTLAGTGSVPAAVSLASGGTISPGDGSPGTLATGNLTLAAGSNFNGIINGSTSGTFTEANVTGTVNLNGAYLNLTGTRTNHDGDVITLINNDGTDPISGTFNNLPQGSKVTVNGVNYVLSYTGGDGNDVTLTDATPPHAANDNYNASENVTLTQNAAHGILANDTGYNGQPLSVYSVDGTTGDVNHSFSTGNGTLTVNSDGSFSYVPNHDFVGTDGATFYVATDGIEQSSSATVQFVVAPGTLTATGTTITGNEGSSTGTVTVAHFTDSAGGDVGEYTASINWGDGSSPTGGTIVSDGSGGWLVQAAHSYDDNGTYNVGVAINSNVGGSTSTTSTANIANVPPTASITGLPTTDVAAGSPVTLTASVTDPSNADTAAGFTDAWNVTDNGASVASGTGSSFTFTPSAAGTYAVSLSATDKDGGVGTTSGSVTAAGTPTVATAAAATLSSDGTYVSLSVLGADAAGESNLTYNWTATSLPTGATAPIFSDSNSNTAKNAFAFLSQAGDYTFQATITNAAGLSTTSSVTIDVTQVATSINVTPASAVLAGGSTQALAASELDQFGNAMASQPAFTWSVESDGEGGTVDSNGNYTAAAAAGFDAVDADADSLTGTAEVSVVTAAPAAPQDVTATADEQSIVLSWDQGDDAATYNVYRGTASGGESATPIATGLTDPTFTDTGLTDGTSYYYTIAAVNPLGEGIASSETSAVPGRVAPTDVAAAPGDHQIIVSWDPMLNATGYNVYRSTTPGGEGSTPYQTDLTDTSFVDAQTSATPYYYTVQAIYAAGGGVISGEVNAAAEVAAPSAPTGLTASAASSSEIDLAWSAGSGADEYVIERSTDGTNFADYDEVDASQTSYQDTGVSDGTTYYYQVRASNAVGDSADSSPASAYTPLAAPDELAASPVSASEIDLSWENNSATATGFIIQRSTGGGAFSTVGTVSGSTTTTYNDTGLSSGVDYTYQVIATAGSAASAASATAEALTLPANLGGLTAAVDSSSQIALSWTPVTGAAGYEIDRQDSNGNWEMYDSVDSGTADSYADTGLNDGTSYTYRVLPYNDSGTSDDTSAPTASATTPLLAPSSPNIVALSPTSVEIVWQDQSASESGYEVQRSTDGADFSDLASVAAGTTNYTDASASPGTRYWYQVEATNSAAGRSGPSFAHNLTTPAVVQVDNSAPTISLASVFTPTENSSATPSATLQVTAPAGHFVEVEEMGPGDTNYQVVDEPQSNISSGSAITFTVSGLCAGDTYQFRAVSKLNGSVEYSTPLEVDIPASATNATLPTPIVTATADYDAYGNEIVDVAISGSYSPYVSFGATLSMAADPYGEQISNTGANAVLGDDGLYHLAFNDVYASGPMVVHIWAADSSGNVSQVATADVTLVPARNTYPADTPTMTLAPLNNGTDDMQLTWSGAMTEAEDPSGGYRWQNVGVMVGSPDGHSSGTTAHELSGTVNPDGTGTAVVVPAGPGAYFFVTSAGGYPSNMIQQPASVTHPVPPDNLTLTPYSGGVHVVWDDINDDESGYVIQRSPYNAGDWADVGSVGADVSNFDDTTTAPSTAYDYRVVALGSQGEREYPNPFPASVTTEALPTVSVTALDPNASAAGPDSKPQDGYFEFTRTGDDSAALTASVNYSGTAVADDDYAGSLPTSVTFPAGQQDVIVPVAPTSTDPDLSSFADALINAGNDYTNASGYAELDLVGAGPAVTLGDGSDNIILQGSSGGTTGAQQLHFSNFPATLPAGSTIELMPSAHAATDVAIWSGDPSQPGAVRLTLDGSGGVALQPGATPPNIWVAAIDGSSAVGDIYFTVRESVPENDGNQAVHSESPPSNAATAVKVSIDLLNNPNGATTGPNGDVTDLTQNWLVGQLADLGADIEAPEGWVPSAEFSWATNGNVLHDYHINGSFASSDPVENVANDETGLECRELKFFWESISAAAGGSDSDPISLTVTVDGKQFSANTTFQVFSATFDNPRLAVASSPTFTHFPGQSAAKVAMNKASIRLPNGNLSSGNGMIMLGSVTLPDEFTGGGSWNFVQTTYGTKTLTDLSGKPKTITTGVVLDSNYPYPGASPYPYPAGTTEYPVGGSSPAVGATDDSPFDYLYGTAYSHLDRKDYYWTYVMFLPAGNGSQWVPLKVLSWGWHTHIDQPASSPQHIFNPVNLWSYGDYSTLTAPARPPVWTENLADTGYLNSVNF